MEDTEEQDTLSRRSSSRRRRSPHRFVAEAATNRVGGDFVQPKRRERPQPPPLEELKVLPESLLNRRIAVSHLQEIALGPDLSLGFFRSGFSCSENTYFIVSTVCDDATFASLQIAE